MCTKTRCVTIHIVSIDRDSPASSKLRIITDEFGMSVDIAGRNECREGEGEVLRKGRPPEQSWSGEKWRYCRQDGSMILKMQGRRRTPRSHACEGDVSGRRDGALIFRVGGVKCR